MALPSSIPAWLALLNPISRENGQRLQAANPFPRFRRCVRPYQPEDLTRNRGRHLIAVEAPGDDGQSKIVMGLAEQKYPGKPWKYLLLDHHHIDHIGGLRAFAAAGATIVVGKGDGAFYRKVLSAPETLNPYGTKQVPPKVEEVDGKWSATEGGRTIEAYSLDNPHSTGYIIPYIPDAKLGFVTDIWSPAPQMPPANPGTTALVKGVQKMGIQMDRMAGGHGGVGNFADLAKTVQ